MVQISEVKGNKRDNRTAAHTHIKGLGLKSDGHAETHAGGFIGQVPAREVCNDQLLCSDAWSVDANSYFLVMRRRCRLDSSP